MITKKNKSIEDGYGDNAVLHADAEESNEAMPKRREVVTLALDHFVKHLQRQQLIALRSRVEWEGDIDDMRQRKSNLCL